MHLLRKLDNAFTQREQALDLLPDLYHEYTERDTGVVVWWAERDGGDVVVHSEDWRKRSVSAQPDDEFLVLDALFTEQQLTFPEFTVLMRGIVSASLHTTDQAVDPDRDFIRTQELATSLRETGVTQVAGGQLLGDGVDAEWEEVFPPS